MDDRAALMHLSTFQGYLLFTRQNVARSKPRITEAPAGCLNTRIAAELDQRHVLEILVRQPSAAADVPEAMRLQMGFGRMEARSVAISHTARSSSC